MASINGYLKNLSDDLFISYGSAERISIEGSFTTLKQRLEAYFGNKIQSVKAFGSYPRGTILPRAYDPKSDIDLLITFNTQSYPEYSTSTYRNNLMNFAKYRYSRSQYYKDFPTVVLELNKIKFDLVPCVARTNFWGTEKLHIPDSYNNWQETEPFTFAGELSAANTRYNSIVKPVIRLLKLWNAGSGYPLASFSLEQEIAGMNFSGDNYESGFFYAIQQLTVSHNKVTTLKNNAERVREYLDSDNSERAMHWLYKILPA
jgi:predicted nucleotidyltransferase